YVFHPDLASFPTRRSSDLYAVPDSVLDIMGDSSALAVVTFMGREKADEADKLIKRLESLFGADPVSFHKMDEATAGDGYTVLRRSEEHTSELQSRENLVCR